MTVEQYLKKLEELKAAAERAVINKAPNLAKAAYQLMAKLLDEGVDVQGGRLVPDERALRFLNTFTDEYLGAFTKDKTYTGVIAQFLKNVKDVGELMQDFQKDQKQELKPGVMKATTEIVVNEIINRYASNGLNPGFVQPLRDLLFNNITGGTNKGQAMDRLREYIAGGKDTTGKLDKYLTQTAQQAVDSYEGAINARIAQTYGIDTYIMSGSLIKTSSPQCRKAINEMDGIIDRADWPKLKALAEENGLIEGTTFENLPFNRLHWNCRHSFTPAVLTAEQRKIITSQPTNE